MAKVKTEKLNFSKFFPETTNFVVVTGAAKSPTDFDLTVEIGDGSDKATYYVSDWMKGDLTSLKAIQEGVNKAIQFYEKALKMPKSQEVNLYSIFDDEDKPVKKAAKKKTK